MPVFGCQLATRPLNDPMRRRERMHQACQIQYAALPYRRRADGAMEILLVTSRETKRWVIPKGWPIKGRRPHVAAAREALEEAGLVGRVDKEPIGTYRYNKRLKNGAAVPCMVEVFPLEVRLQKKKWPEKGQRSFCWLSPEDAAEAVEEAGLGEAIRTLRSRALPDLSVASSAT
jgi:8-oxo-dGTP pyrophosphatase MutT (NUDIX family)